MLEHVLIFLIGGALGAAFGRRRWPSTFPYARALAAPKALSAPSRQSVFPPPSKEALCDLAGILVIQPGAIDPTGGWVRDWFVEKDGQRVDLSGIGAPLPETLCVDTAPIVENCAHCGKGHEVSIYLAMRISDQSWSNVFVVATYCEKCGEKKPQRTTGKKARPGAVPRVVNRVYDKPIGPFDAMTNLYDVLHALAQKPGRLMKEVRLRRLSEEYGQLHPRVGTVAKKIARLQRKLMHPFVRNVPGKSGIEARIRGLSEEYERIQPPVARLVEEINALREELLANGVRPRALPARVASL